MSLISQISIRIYHKKYPQLELKQDLIAEEVKVIILKNKKKLAELYTSPLYLKELCAGFLLTELNSKLPLENLEIIKHKGFYSINLKNPLLKTSKKFGQPPEKDFILSAEEILEIFKEFLNTGSETFRKTGCTHAVGIAENKKILFLAEDISRFCALDKVIGWCILNQISLYNKLLLTTGRITLKFVKKAEKAGIKVILSKGAPSYSAVKFARRKKISVLGFVRENRFNVYSGAERISV